MVCLCRDPGQLRAAVQELYLAYNQLTGTIPADWPLPSSMTVSVRLWLVIMT